jgi:hypothetical protein
MGDITVNYFQMAHCRSAYTHDYLSLYKARASALPLTKQLVYFAEKLGVLTPT